MNLVASPEGFKKRFLMYLKVEGGHYRKEDLNDLKLHLVVSFCHTITDRLNNGINQLPRESPIHIGRGSLFVRVDAVVFAVSVQELIRNQLLDYIEDVLHDLGYLGIKCHLQNVEVLVSIIGSFFLQFDFL
jgi:hypothetical protein